MSNFRAVIRWLNSGIASQTKAEKKFWHEHPFVPPTDDESLRAAIRLLEAAGKVDKQDAQDLMEYFGRHCGRGHPNQINALLAALPDKEEDR